MQQRSTWTRLATAVVIDYSGVPEQATVVVDHPFLLVIRDQPTGALLFMGRVVDPS